MLVLFYFFVAFGLSSLCNKWVIIQTWSAVAIVAQIIFQFMATIVTEQKTNGNNNTIWDKLDTREKAWLYWIGF